MAVIIDSAVSCLPEKIGHELAREIASGRRGGALSDAVLPLNAALLSRAARIETLRKQVEQRDQLIAARDAEIEGLKELVDAVRYARDWYERLGEVCSFEGMPMIYSSVLLELAEKADALTTTPQPTE